MKELVNSRTHSLNEYRAFVSEKYFSIQLNLAGFTKDDIDISIDKNTRIMQINAQTTDYFFGKLIKVCEFDIGNNINIECPIETSLELGILTLRFAIAQNIDTNISVRNYNKLTKIHIK